MRYNFPVGNSIWFQESNIFPGAMCAVHECDCFLHWWFHEVLEEFKKPIVETTHHNSGFNSKLLDTNQEIRDETLTPGIAFSSSPYYLPSCSHFHAWSETFQKIFIYLVALGLLCSSWT